MNKKIVLAIVIAVIVVSGGYGIYLYQENLEAQIQNPMPQSPTLEITHLTNISGGNGFDQLAYAEAIHVVVNDTSRNFVNPFDGKVVFRVSLERTDSLKGVHNFTVNLEKNLLIQNVSNPAMDAYLLSNITLSVPNMGNYSHNFNLGMYSGQTVNITVTEIINPQAVLNLYAQHNGYSPNDQSYEIYFGQMDAMINVVASGVVN